MAPVKVLLRTTLVGTYTNADDIVSATGMTNQEARVAS